MARDANVRELPVRTYSPESALRHPGKLARDMVSDLVVSRELAWRLFVRDISARYRQSVLGYVWAFLPPILATLTFVALRQGGVLQTGDTPVPYPVYVLTGTLLWQVFVDAVSSPIKNVTAAKSMLVKLNFPREAILLSCVYEVWFNVFIRLILLAAALIYYGVVPPQTILLAPLGVIAIFCFGFLIGVILTPLGVLYADVAHALPMLLSLLMLFTPVVYVAPSSGFMRDIAAANPMSSLLVSTRDLILVGFPGNIAQPAITFAATLALLLLGWVLYRVAMPILVERIGS